MHKLIIGLLICFFIFSIEDNKEIPKINLPGMKAAYIPGHFAQRIDRYAKIKQPLQTTLKSQKIFNFEKTILHVEVKAGQSSGDTLQLTSVFNIKNENNSLFYQGQKVATYTNPNQHEIRIEFTKYANQEALDIIISIIGFSNDHPVSFKDRQIQFNLINQNQQLLSSASKTITIVGGQSTPPNIHQGDGISSLNSKTYILDSLMNVDDLDSSDFHGGALYIKYDNDVDPLDLIISINTQIPQENNIFLYNEMIFYHDGEKAKPICATQHDKINKVYLYPFFEYANIQSVSRLLQQLTCTNKTGQDQIIQIVINDGDGGTSEITSITIPGQ